MKNNTIIFTILGIVLIGGFIWYGSQRTSEAPSMENDPVTHAMENGLIITDTVVGTGKEVFNGSAVSVHYTGRLEDGTKFDSSLDRNQPFVFVVGQNKVIKGWELGLLGMKVGGKRTLTIPSELGYGVTGAGNVIPPNATLIFDIELLDTATMEEIQAMQSGQ